MTGGAHVSHDAHAGTIIYTLRPRIAVALADILSTINDAGWQADAKALYVAAYAVSVNDAAAPRQ